MSSGKLIPSFHFLCQLESQENDFDVGVLDQDKVVGLGMVCPGHTLGVMSPWGQGTRCCRLRNAEATARVVVDSLWDLGSALFMVHPSGSL